MKWREKTWNMERRIRSLGKRLGGRAVILLYHRVAEGRNDPQLLKVSPAHVQEHIDVLRARGCKPVRLVELPDALKNRTWSDSPLFAVTFDDGYADNLTVAAPLLERNRIPATVYVTTSTIGHPRELWWDELDRLLLGAVALPDRLTLDVRGRKYEWTTRGAAHAGGWNALAPPRTDRERAYLELAVLLHTLRPDARTDILNRVRDWAGAPPTVRAEVRTMTTEELRRLSEICGFDIGAHTVRHPMLSGLTWDEQQYEILESKRILESLVNREIYSFSYPYGRIEDYTPATVSLVRKAGFRNACSNFPGIAHRFCSSFQLPRLCVYDWTGVEFARRLDEALR